MTYFSTFQELIRDLCRKHKALLHEQGGVAFIPMSFDDESAAIVPNMKPVYVKLMSITTSGRNVDSLFWEAQIRILANIRMQAPKAKEVEDARNITQMIMLDFDARIRWEFELQDEDSRCYFLKAISEPNMIPVGLVDQSAIGWDYFFRFETDRAAYDATRWTE